MVFWEKRAETFVWLTQTPALVSSVWHIPPAPGSTRVANTCTHMHTHANIYNFILYIFINGWGIFFEVFFIIIYIEVLRIQ